jgi:hypothetical protein
VAAVSPPPPPNGTITMISSKAAAWSRIVTRITLVARVASPAAKSELPNPSADSSAKMTASIEPTPVDSAHTGEAR